jgi:DNA-binding CsgD family transcriptional regulator
MLLEELPDQIFKLKVDGTVVEAVHGCAGMALIMPVVDGLGMNLRELLAAPIAESILDGLRVVAKTRRIVSRRLDWNDDGGTHACEARLVPASDGGILVIVRELGVDVSLGGEPAMDARLGAASSRAIRQNEYRLTTRELTVLEFVTRGAADKEIATQLGVSVFTVNKHVSNILRKMGASSRTEASTRTLREGLVS